MNIRNEIKSYIVRKGMTMSGVLERLVEECGWSSSVPNFSDKLQHGSLRYSEAKDWQTSSAMNWCGRSEVDDDLRLHQG